MEQTPLPPLVSEERFRTFIEEWNGSIDEWERSVEQQCYRILRDKYEADRAKTREVVQRLVDALDRISTAGNFLSAAAKRFMDDPSKSNNGDLQLSRSLWVEADCALDAALSELEAQPSAPTVEGVKK